MSFSLLTTPGPVDKTMLAPGGFGNAFGNVFFPPYIGATTDTASAALRMYYAEVHVPWPVTVTGIAVANGSAPAGNLQTALYDASGNRLALSASVAQAGVLGRQKVPFSAPVDIPQGTYFIAVATTSTGKLMTSQFMGAGGFVGVTNSIPPATIVPADYTSLLVTLAVMGLY
jgi:hypothetical protein